MRFLDDLFPRRVFFLFSSRLITQTIGYSIIVFSRKSINYLPQTQSAEAMPFTFFMLLDQFCYTAEAEATSFLRSSYGHPQVQTVPSTAWVAPCPVVTPSR